MVHRTRIALTGVIAAALALTGCATCREHPIACTVATVVVTGAIVASTPGHDDGPSHERQVIPRIKGGS
jgi:hypothetical protein